MVEKPAEEAPKPNEESPKNELGNLLDDAINLPEASMPIIPVLKDVSDVPEVSTPEDKSSRQRGLEELDFLGESLLKQHLPAKSPQFEKKKEEKLSLNLLQQKQKEKDLVPELPTEVSEVQTETKEKVVQPSENGHTEVKLADLDVPLSSIKPGKTPPMTLQVSFCKPFRPTNV